MKKRILAVVLCVLLASLAVVPGCGKEEKKVLKVYNWGEYIDEDLIAEFEKEYGIDVIYDTFATNEEMYPRIEADSSLYDVICPSEYMVEKMMKNGLLQEIDHTKLSNWKNIGESYLKILSDYIDPDNKYLVPYCWGTVGILYNTKLVDEEVDSWGILWDEKYAGSILMQDSVRDAFMVAQKYLGYSLNDTDQTHLEECAELLRQQYPLVKSYVIDEVRDKMIAGNTALGVIYSGEYLYCLEMNEDLAYALPKEGSNVWYDGWVITKNSKNVEEAYLWIDFLLRAENAAKNFDYITYPTPNVAAREFIDEEILNDQAVFPEDEQLKNCEMYIYLGQEAENRYYELWKTVK